MEENIKKNILVIVAAAFPYGSGETFLEAELPYYLKSFDKILIFCSRKNHGTKIDIDKSIDVYLFDENSNNIITQLFNFKIWIEIIRYLLNSESIKSLNGIKHIVRYHDTAIRKSSQIINTLKEHQLISENNSITAYASWMSESAYAIGLMKNKVKLYGVAKAHRYDLYEHENEYKFLPFRKYIVKNLDQLFFISQNGLNYFKRKYSYSEKLSIARLGVSAKPFKPRIKTDTLTILSCSYILHQKRIDLIIDSLEHLNEIKIKWIHIGDTPKESDWIKINKYADEKLKEKENIEYSFLGYMSNQNVMEFYTTENVDVFINLSSSEGIPITMMECMSYSIPVITTEVGGIAEMVENDRNGYLLDAHPSSKEVANSIRKFHQLSETEINSFRKNAYRTWNDKFNAEKNYTTFTNKITKPLINE